MRASARRDDGGARAGGAARVAARAVRGAVGAAAGGAAAGQRGGHLGAGDAVQGPAQGVHDSAAERVERVRGAAGQLRHQVAGRDPAARVCDGADVAAGRRQGAGRSGLGAGCGRQAGKGAERQAGARGGEGHRGRAGVPAGDSAGERASADAAHRQQAEAVFGERQLLGEALGKAGEAAAGRCGIIPTQALNALFLRRHGCCALRTRALSRKQLELIVISKAF
ncbi:photosystem II oxygen-evolving complex 23kDa protein [Gracilaria domingensis]|nr:photosystem II oxygen-evolving complex 23kDa protein [Gracilaria domingensis]